MKRRQYARLLSAREVAEIIGKTPGCVRRYVYAERLRAVRHQDDKGNMHFRFRPCDVEAFLGVPLERAKS